MLRHVTELIFIQTNSIYGNSWLLSYSHLTQSNLTMSFWKALFPKKYREKQITQKNKDHIESGIKATISDKFSSFLEGDRHSRKNTFQLPQYNPAVSISENDPLVYLDILGAHLDNYWRARLLLYETAQQARPLVSMLGRKSFKLDPVLGSARPRTCRNAQ
ncbi:hypothetical protein BO83DRAFT_393554 [Aspergillus eucalypticola CBS 122712]|uniref:Uncharacterized protein n=1 Tax=Aspergillus eucalypticola (strain CBS 122712 / IBT 29274) TaxID=1448314 RepID=A0A317UNP6_ASPEC|nr:uncharacterized protein BO83DRAFT_393554 [Aspergillus eucalypticola CBS 122712]PWY63039.1 hypothetical protein BO83DRAFT_393554 [Aspergillus eucalypticola CBS 122712]